MGEGGEMKVSLYVFQFRRAEVGVGSIDENSAMMIKNNRSFVHGWRLWAIEGNEEREDDTCCR